jgi:Ni/Co efflux regulator RcnB
MLKALVCASTVSIIAAASASAAPAPPPAQLRSATPDAVLQVQDRHHNGERRSEHRRGRDHRYTAGRRYDRAPSHYRRYSHRPNDWESRGCILVGPLWFCA